MSKIKPSVLRFSPSSSRIKSFMSCPAFFTPGENSARSTRSCPSPFSAQREANSALPSQSVSSVSPSPVRTATYSAPSMRAMASAAGSAPRSGSAASAAAASCAFSSSPAGASPHFSIKRLKPSLVNSPYSPGRKSLSQRRASGSASTGASQCIVASS